ncbi:MAG: sulfatase-like hydrolase/transferase, partial [Planctomycetota bacterium]
RFDALACSGNPDIQTPNLDRLANAGRRFSHCFVQNPVCMPSRVSMLSGRYPSNLGIMKMGYPAPEDLPTLATILRGAGYTTANIGKLHFLPHSNRDHREPHPSYGFDHLEISDEPGPYDDAYRAYIRKTHPDQLDLISSHVYPPAAKQWREAINFEDTVRHPEHWEPWKTCAFAGSDDATHTAFVGQRTIDYINAHHAGKPFFCISGFYSPHSPLVAPQSQLDRYDPTSFKPPNFPPEVETRRNDAGFSDQILRQAMHGYYAMVSEVDDWIGRIMEALQYYGIAKNTMVVFTSDHGEYLGEHLCWGKWHPAPDCVSRVPLLISGPGVEPGVCDGLVEAVDIAPTLLECAGVPVPASLDGFSLRPSFTGDLLHKRTGALIEDANHATSWRGLRTQTHRYILHADGAERLYDLNAEFGEYRDVAVDPRQAESLNNCRHALATRMIEIAYTHPKQWPY